MGIEILDEEVLNIETNDGWNELPYEEKDPVFKASAAYGISSTDITNWNNKSEFSGNYNDLTNKPVIPTNSDFTLNGLSEKSYNNLTDKPSIPSKTSDLQNDSGFITNAVDNLLNYYKKSETFTKQEVNDLISAITTMDIQVVQTLPTQDISTTTIYFVPKTTAETNNAYDEYIYVSNAWEFIGSTEVDLTDYVKNTDYATDSKGGTFKYSADYGTFVNGSGLLMGVSRTYAQYQAMTDRTLISKIILENVLNARIGDISSVLDAINGEVI